MHYDELKGRGLQFLLFLCFLWFVNMSVRVIFSPILPLIEDEYVITHARASSIFIFQSIGYGVSILLAGFFAGRTGYKRSITISLIISAVTCFVIPFVKIFSALYLFSFILGISVGVYLPSAIPLITEYFAEKHWGKSIAIHDCGASIAIFTIPFITLFVVHFFQWRGIFTLFGVVFLINAIVFHLISKEVKVNQAEKHPLGSLIKAPSLWVMGVLFVFAAGANLGIYGIAPLYLTKELSFSIEYANSMLGASRLAGIGIAILVGFVVDKISLTRVISGIVLATGLLTILIGVVPAGYVGTFLVLQALVVTGFFPLGLVAIAKLFTKEERSLATGIILTFGIIFGGGIIPYLLGLSGDLVNFRFGIIILGLLVALMSPLAFFIRGVK